MINLGKCPKCEKIISKVKYENISASSGIGGTEWNAISYCCQSCNTVLSVQIDPVALNTDLLKELGK